MKANPSLYDLLPVGPYDDLDDFKKEYLGRAQNKADAELYAVLAKPQPGDADQTERLAGTVGYLNSSPANAATEIGWVRHTSTED